jgi:small redox-active disulfide protein 2
MLKIEVFVGGCPKCKKTEMNSKEALAKLGVEAEIVAVKSQVEILKKGVTSTPALAINGEVKCMGRIPETKEIITWLQDTK